MKCLINLQLEVDTGSGQVECSQVQLTRVEQFVITSPDHPLYEQFLLFIGCGEASLEFMELLDRDESVQKAVSVALDKRMVAIRETLEALRGDGVSSLETPRSLTAPTLASNMTRAGLEAVVDCIQGIFYIDDVDHVESWNPDKSLSGADVVDAISDLFQKYGLAPKVVCPL